VSKKKIVVYTAIFGGYDQLKPLINHPGCDYVCFTDDASLQSDIFQIRVRPRHFDDPVREARYYKILSHQVFPDYEYSLWMDAGARSLLTDLESFVLNSVAQYPIALMGCPGKIDLNETLALCMQYKKDDESRMRAQVEEYQKAGYPKGIPTSATGVIVRDHTNAKVKEFNEAWWAEVARHSRRDQLSVNYVAWKLGLKLHTIEELEWKPPCHRCKAFIFEPHQKDAPIVR
jgi:hypothetical protein